MIKFPGRDYGGVFSFLKGFTFKAWLGSLGLLLIFPAILHFCYILLHYCNLKEPVKWNFEFGLFIFLGAISQQGSDSTPKFLSIRIIFFMIFIGSVYILQAFSASYTSFLSVPKELKPFNTIEELYKSTNYKIGSLIGTADFELFNVRIIAKKNEYLSYVF